ncbi:beta-xylosidase/AraC-like DNA-binding protein [Catenibacillus scindens]|uniref:Beta-xylosidase/AraC-like DNA-binding protein n=1 Tax=Catenibacillus scindens TaxID=673271 RepID=A0A7W8HCM8_9FIRM|nr:helix-turn-helix domain-containing protein [Catenibacillus scindens]MBB5265918.1 beta-xylosidase/AraC-like DNA-binding protein [Catenibacillus scindens]
MNEKTMITPVHNISLYNISKEYTLNLSEYEIFMVLHGSIHIRSETYEDNYEARDLLILNPGKSYIISPLEENLVLSLAFEKHFIHEVIGNNHQIFCDSREAFQKDYEPMRNLVASIVSAYFDNAEGNKLTIYSMIFSLLAMIQKNFTASTINLSDTSENSKHLSRIQEIISYVDENYPSVITLASLAEHLYLSPQYLSKFIKQHFHKTFYEYLNQVRIEHALSEIQYTDTSITKIAFNCGFPNLTAFNKIFKEFYHTTPSSYRKEFRQSAGKQQLQHEGPMDEDISTQNIENVRAYLSDLSLKGSQNDNKSPGADTNHYVISANMTESVPQNNPFTRIINAGYAVNMLSFSFLEQLESTFKSVDFTYIRFIGILDDDILPEVEGDKTSGYNFHLVDMILDFLFERGKIPFLELSSKPRKTTIATTRTGFLTNSGNFKEKIFPPSHFQKLDMLIRHCINRYGLSFVSSWYFEVWAAHSDYLEYDESGVEYAQRFKKIHTILSAHLPVLHLGGPGFNTSAPLPVLHNFIQEVNREKLSFSFLSLYLYPYKVTASNLLKQKDDYVILSADKDIFSKKLSFIKSSLSSFYRQLPPVIVTEFNSDLAGQNHINDSCFQSAFICRNFLKLKNDVDMMAYWLLSDLTEEYMDFSSTKKGGIGLFNEQGQKKPAFFAYEFLNQLGNAVICEGDNYIVTMSSTNHYQILAFNYAHVSKYYCLSHSDKVNVQDTYSIFDPVSPVNMTFQLYNLEAGQYKIKRHVLDRDHGSLLDTMAHMWFQGNLSFERLSYNISNLSPEEQEYFSMACIPSQSIFYKNSDGSLTLNCKVSAHEVIFYDISLQLQ